MRLPMLNGVVRVSRIRSEGVATPRRQKERRWRVGYGVFLNLDLVWWRVFVDVNDAANAFRHADDGCCCDRSWRRVCLSGFVGSIHLQHSLAEAFVAEVGIEQSVDFLWREGLVSRLRAARRGLIEVERIGRWSCAAGLLLREKMWRLRVGCGVFLNFEQL